MRLFQLRKKEKEGRQDTLYATKFDWIGDIGNGLNI